MYTYIYLSNVLIIFVPGAGDPRGDAEGRGQQVLRGLRQQGAEVGELEPGHLPLHQMCRDTQVITVRSQIILFHLFLDRNLGVHISRVKSVNLDSWTPQQVAVSDTLLCYH